MARTTRCLTRLGLVAAMLTVLAGCPTGPVLVVTPQSIHFGSDDTIDVFRVYNRGIGTLTWNVAEDIPWLSMSQIDGPQGAAQIQGSVTDEPAVFEVNVNRSQIPLGESYGTIQVLSNGGERAINISISATGPAVLQVSETEIDLGFDQDDASFTLGNSGTSVLQYTATVDPASDWLRINSAVSSTGTIDANAAPRVLIVSVDRNVLTAGVYTGTIGITSNGGQATVTVTASVPSFTVSPASIDFETIEAPDALALEVSNRGNTDINLTASAESGGWLSVAPTDTVLGAGQPLVLQVTADPTGLTPGDFTGTITITDTDSGYARTIDVAMTLSGFTVAPGSIDFGTISAPASDTIRLTNLGAQAADWSISVPAAAGWLSVDPSSGSVGATQDVAVNADPLAVDPGDYNTTLTVTHAGGTDTVAVHMTRPRPPALEVSSENLDFGASTPSRFLGVIHAGDEGTIDWSIDTADFPAWLSITTTDSRVSQAGGVFSGTLTPEDGNRSHGLTVRVQRELAPPGLVNYSHTFDVVGSNAVTTTIAVSITMIVPILPEIEISADDIDEFGVDFVSLPISDTTRTFQILNTDGLAPLTWSLSTDDLPAWLVSVSPSRGTIPAGGSVTVQVTVDRTGLSYGPLQHLFTLTSNDPDEGALPLRIETQVPKKPQIGTRGNLNFGVELSAVVFEVANIGDPDTQLNFKVTSNKEWVSIFPDTGQSTGVDSPFKDWQALSVTVDRTALEGVASTAIVTIQAFDRIDGKEVPREDVPVLTATVSVEAASLIIEAPRPRLRTPSLVRYDLLFRNVRSQVIDFTQTSELLTLQNAFSIEEKNVSVETTETNQLVRDGKNLPANVLIALDYSNSMVEAAKMVEDPNIANAGDPLQALYADSISALIAELPAHYRVALGVFNERRQISIQCPVSYETLRIIDNNDGLPVFISDKAALQARLDSIVVTDHGASEILPAALDCVNALFNEEKGKVPFDDTPLRSVIFVSDGRITTSSVIAGNLAVTDIADALVAARVRFYPIGWGTNVISNPLIRMAEPSGGHYYSAKTVRSGVPDEFGRVTRLPLASELRGWCGSDPLALDGQHLIDTFAAQDTDTNGRLTYAEALGGVPGMSQFSYDRLDRDQDHNLTVDELTETVEFLTVCDQTIPQDLASHVVLSYVTLSEDSNVGVEGRVTFNDINDKDSPCLPEQNSITGGFAHSQLAFDLIAGDVRLGQISLHTQGVLSNNTARVVVRAEYMPRNVNRLRIRVTPAGAANPTVTLVPSTQGGIISNWTLTPSGTVYDVAPADGTPLSYGDFGDLLYLDFTNVNLPFTLGVDVELPSYNASNPDGKYFTVTDSFDVGLASSMAPAFPNPEVRTDETTITGDCPLTVNLGQTGDTAVFQIFNTGGHHSPTGVWLEWEVALGAESTGLTLDPASIDDIPNIVTSTLSPDTLTVSLDRTLEPGIYIGSIELTYNFGSVGVALAEDPIYITYEVTPPDLVLSVDSLDFGAAATDLPLTLSNGGQGILNWQIDTTLLPQWIQTGKSGGSLIYDVDFSDNVDSSTDTFLVRVFRGGLNPGDYSTKLVLKTDNGLRREVDVTMTVPPPAR